KKWKSLDWPGLSPFDDDLYDAACDVMELDTFIAGCISQVIETGKLDKKFWHVLVVDQDLTNRIANMNDPKKHKLLEYKTELDDCIHLARVILQLEES
ncbi:MAG: hypothetical protein SVX38_15885, partial [Chloroflexota bacterium]|nr:hypothetical protein [Chloroflexota bacterium]